MNCLNLEDKDVKQWVDNVGLVTTYAEFLKNGYLPDYSQWKQYNTGISMEETRDVLNSILPLDSFQIKPLTDLMDSLPLETVGAYLNQVIYLTENPSKSEIYEEGFHAIFDKLLTEEDKQTLLKASQSLLANRLKKQNKTINSYLKEIEAKYPEVYSNQSQEDKLKRLFEEELAGMYVDSLQYNNPFIYQKNIKDTLKPIIGESLADKVSQLLTKLFQLFKSLFKMYDRERQTIDLFFKEINEGKYKNAPIITGDNSQTVPFTRLLELVAEKESKLLKKTVNVVKVFTPEQTQSAIRNIGAIYFQLESEKLVSKQEDRINKAVELYFELMNEYNSGYYKDVNIQSDKNKEAVDYLKQDIKEYIDGFKSIVDFDSDVIESEEETSNSFNDYESSADEKDPFDSSYSRQLKLRIGKTGRVVYLKQKQIEGKDVYLKLIESVDVHKTYYAIARALSNTLKDEDRWNKLINFSNLEGNTDSKAFVDQLLFDLFRNHKDIINVGKDASPQDEYKLKLEKIKEKYEAKEKGFVIFPVTEEDKSKVISSSNAVIINSIIKGFDLWKRINYVITFDQNKKSAIAFDSNNDNVVKIQTNTWKNILSEKHVDRQYILEQLNNFNTNTITFQYTSIEEADKDVNKLFNYFSLLGIPLSKEYLRYSLYNYLYNKSNIPLLDNFNVEEDLILTREQLQYVSNSIKDYFSKEESDINQSVFGESGVKGRLEKIAQGNGYFDERIPDSTYKTADGKTKYNYQYKTYHLQKIDEILNNPSDINTYKVLVADNEYLEEGLEFITGNEQVQANYLFEQFSKPEYQKLLKQGKIFTFSADGLRLSEKDEYELGQLVRKGREEDGVTIGKMTNRDFMVYLMNLSGGLMNSKSNGLSPVYFGNYEASKTYEFINLPMIQKLIDDKGSLSDIGIELISNEIQKEYERIKRIAGTESFDTIYTKYNSGNRFPVKYKDRVFYVPYKVDNKTKKKSIDFGNFRAMVFSDYVNNLSSNLSIPDDFKTYLEELINQGSDTVEIDERFDNSSNPLVNAFLGKDFNSNSLDIKQSVDTMMDELIKMFIDNNLVSKEGEPILIDNFYKTAEANKHKAYDFKNNDTFNNIKKKFISDLLNTMFLNQLMQGDQALLYKNDLVDMFKRFKGRNASINSFTTNTIAPELGINKTWKTMQYLVHSEIESRSGIDGSGIDQADAQNYTTSSYMRYALYAMGRLTKEHAEILDKIDNGEPLGELEKTVFNLQVFTPILKTVYFDGRVYLKKSDYMLSKHVTSRFKEYKGNDIDKHLEEVNGKYVPKIGATKELVRWSDGNIYEVLPNQNKELHERRKVMEGWRYNKSSNTWNYTGNEIMISMPISASKMLNRNTLKGSDLKNIEDKNINTLDLQYYGLQVETPHPHDKIPDPTQYLEIALNELQRNSTTEFYIDNKKYNVNELENLYQELLVQRRKMKFDELEKQLLDSEGNPKLEEFRTKFVKSLESSGAEKQTVELVSKGYNMNIPLIRDKFISQIFSSFTKDVLSQKRPGDASAHISSYGHKLVKKVKKHVVNGNTVWSWEVVRNGTSEYNSVIDTDLIDLSSKDFYPDVDGKPSQNRINNHLIDGKDNSLQSELEKLGEGAYFVDELRHLKPRIEDGVITGYFTEMLLAKYDINQKDMYDQLKYMFGVRIPSQDKHSGVNLEWVDMLPSYYGSAVVVAKEIVQLSGSDFDIDKLYISKPDGYYNKEGFKMYDNSFEDFVKYQLKDNSELKNLIKETKQSNESYNKFKDLVNQIRENKKDDYELLESKKKELNLIIESSQNKEIKNYLKILELTDSINEIENLQTLEQYGYATVTSEQLDLRKEYLKELRHLYKITSVKKSDIDFIGKEKLINFLPYLEDYYLSQKANNTLYEDALQSLNIELKRIESNSLKQLGLPYNEETYKEYLNKYQGFGNRGYINNLLLQANQQGLGNNQTLDGKISDTPASMTYMAKGVLKEFETQVDGKPAYLLSDNGKDYVNTNKTKYNVHSLLGQIITDKNNRTGKANIGIDVNWNLLNIVLNRINAEINPDNSVIIEDSKYDSLELFIKNNPDLRVFDVISTLISSATDEAKEQLNARYGLNIDALNAVLPFVAMGGNLSLGIAIVNQPLVKEYLNLKAVKNHAITTGDESQLKFKSDKDFIEKVLNNNRLGIEYQQLLEMQGELSLEDLAKGLRGEFDDKVQLRALRDFLKLSAITEYGNNIVAGIKLKKGLPSDLYSYISTIEKLNKISLNKNDLSQPDTNPIYVLEALDKNKYTKGKEIVEAVNLVEKIDSIIPKFISVLHPVFNLFRNELSKESKRLGTTALQEVNSELETFIYGQLFNKELEKAGEQDSQLIKYISSLLIDKNSEQNIVKEFLKFKNSAKKSDVFKDNPLLDKLEIVQSDKSNIVSLKINQLVKLSDTQMTELSDAYTQLANNFIPIEEGVISPSEFSKMLFALFIVKDGFQFKYAGVSKIFPAETMSRLSSVIDKLQKIKDTNVFEGDLKQYINTFIDRYFQSVKHQASLVNINRNNKDEVFTEDNLKVVYILNTDTASHLNGKDSKYRYISYTDKKKTSMVYQGDFTLSGKSGTYSKYKEFIPNGETSTTTMTIPLGQQLPNSKGEIKPVIKEESKKQENVNDKKKISTINIEISNQDYTKNTPSDKTKGFFFTENLQAYLANRGRGSEVSFDLHPSEVKLNVTTTNNQAGIRRTITGKRNLNSFAIISKKFQQDGKGNFVKEEGQFKDTEEDFNLFKKYNTEAIEEAKKSNLPLVISSKGIATGKSALPLRFVQWLNGKLQNELGVSGTIKENTALGYKGYGIFNLQKPQEKTAITFDSKSEYNKYNIGDVFTLDSVDVEVVNKYKLKGSGLTVPRWAELTGLDKDYFEKNIKPNIDDYYQIEFKVVDRNNSSNFTQSNDTKFDATCNG